MYQIKKIDMNFVPGSIHKIRSVDKNKFHIEITEHVNQAWRNLESGRSYYVAISVDRNFNNYEYFLIRNGISFEKGLMYDDLFFNGSSIPDCAKSGKFIALFAFTENPCFTLVPSNERVTSHNSAAYEKGTKYIKISIKVQSSSPTAEIAINSIEITQLN